jgi:acylphosphatase
MTKHYNIHVIGKVQGVYYRASTREQALKLAITGFVQNLPNGDVYIEAEGDEKSLDKLIEWCKKGPSASRVDNLKTIEGEIRKYTDFIIKR